MDFALSETQEVLDDVARGIFADLATHDRLKTLEQAGGGVFDRDLWHALAGAGITAAPVPEAHSGSGLGLLDLLPVLEATGEHVAPVPVLETLALAAPLLAAHGDDAMRSRWLPGIADGSLVGTAALDGGEPATEVALPDVSATSAGGWELSGTARFVPYGGLADVLVLAATTDAGPGLFVVTPRESDGAVTASELVTTNRKPLADLRFERTAARPLVTPGNAARTAIRDARLRGAAAACAIQAGVCRGALRMLADHTSNREQFGKPIAEFQAVAQRAADAFVDAEMVQLTARQAVYQLDAGLDAAAAVHTAKFWAGDGAMRVVHAAQHLHGGLGVDLDYPLHRYFLWAKQHEHTFGTPTRELIRLGGLLADEPV